MSTPKRRQIAVIRKPVYGMADPDRPVVGLTFLADCGVTGASPWLPPEQATVLLRGANCTVDQLEGRFCLVNFDRAYIEFERLLTQDEVLYTVNQLLSDGEVRHGPLADEGVGA